MGDEMVIRFGVGVVGMVMAFAGLFIGNSPRTVTLPASGQAYNCGSPWSPAEAASFFASTERVCETALRGLEVTAWVVFGIGAFLVAAIVLMWASQEGQRKLTP